MESGETCFNPCFHGSTTVRWAEFCREEIDIKFQSLFSWKYNCEQSILSGSTKISYVSILVFMEVQL
ncbi:Uncharacterized protein dnl_30440 [Desulfonema limicola]|uniref:Uncharacterized protein n=1 Tax=Desulfonema limicola TaxID=45656 RepID=A0A975B896_9BACT|nr:Uncharacterized protein dnl_30440 [Desulfonema limicola]